MAIVTQPTLFEKTPHICRFCGLAIQDGPAVHSCITRDAAGTATHATCRATFDGVSVAECDTVFAAWDVLDEHVALLRDAGLLPGALQRADEAAAVVEAAS